MLHFIAIDLQLHNIQYYATHCTTAITLKIPCTNNWQYDTKWNA